jgi:2-octaprenyl-6-methoxyphenol hydroxylase
MKPADPEVLIVGGGHAGLWLGAALARHGVAVALLDPDPPAAALHAASDGRTLALLGGSRRVGERHGLWPALAPIAAPVRRVEVVDVTTGSRVDYDGRDQPDGCLAWGVEAPALRAALATAFLATAGAGAWRRGRLQALRREGHRVVAGLAGGGRIEASLLIGADGRGSRVRELIGLQLVRHRYDQAALAFAVGHARPHGAAVRERLRPAGPLALLPLPGNRSGVTWVEPEAEARRLATLPSGELLAILDRETGGVLGSLELASPVAVWPLGAQHARRYVAPRVALVGDAAHGVHPIHAQGFNMGVADIAALAELLADARRRGRDLGGADLLLAYERARWWDNERRLRLTDGLVRLFSNDLLPARVLRGAALRAIDLLPPLKALAVREGMRAG